MQICLFYGKWSLYLRPPWFLHVLYQVRDLTALARRLTTGIPMPMSGGSILIPLFNQTCNFSIFIKAITTNKMRYFNFNFRVFYLFIHSITGISGVHSFVYSFIQLISRLFIHLFTHPFNHSFIHLYIKANILSVKKLNIICKAG